MIFNRTISDALALPGWLLEEARQRRHPPEFRIGPPPPLPVPAPAPPTPPATLGNDGGDAVLEETHALICELAACLWYLKTRHLKTAWGDNLGQADDPLTRRSLRRIARAVEAMEAVGVEVSDPVGAPYRAGSEQMLKANFARAECEEERIVETIEPVVFVDNRVARRGEVVVEVPQAPAAAVPQPQEDPEASVRPGPGAGHETAPDTAPHTTSDTPRGETDDAPDENPKGRTLR